LKKLLIIPLLALIAWGGVKLVNHLRPPTPSEMIRSVHESLPPPADLPIIVTPTPPDVRVTWPNTEKRVARTPRKPAPLPRSRPVAPLQCVAEETPVPVVPRCLFWIIGEPGCRP
jgi:hypothetical protein